MALFDEEIDGAKEFDLSRIDFFFYEALLSYELDLFERIERLDFTETFSISCRLRLTSRNLEDFPTEDWSFYLFS